MRAYALVLSLMLGTASIAFAQETPADKAAASAAASAEAPAAKPETPTADAAAAGEKSEKPASSIPVTEKPAAEKKVEKPADEKSSEPNMQVIKGSGGKVSSSMITDAPLLSDFVMGQATAPVVMVEYASMSCPHCAHFSNVVLPEIEKNYIKTGKLRYILRQFPLNEPALKAAMLLACVGDQDKKKYYVFARVLFDAQSKWAFDANYLTGLETIASVGGLSKDQFQNCVNNTDRETKILKMKKDATEDLKIPHTPYMYIGDEIYSGDRTAEAIGAFIDAKLAQSKNRSWLPKW